MKNNLGISTIYDSAISVNSTIVADVLKTKFNCFDRVIIEELQQDYAVITVWLPQISALLWCYREVILIQNVHVYTADGAVRKPIYPMIKVHSVKEIYDYMLLNSDREKYLV